MGGSSLCLGRAKAFFCIPFIRSAVRISCEFVLARVLPSEFGRVSIHRRYSAFLGLLFPLSPRVVGFARFRYISILKAQSSFPSLFPLLLSHQLPSFLSRLPHRFFRLLACNCSSRLAFLSTLLSLRLLLSAKEFGLVCPCRVPAFGPSRFTNKVFLVSILRRCFSFHAHILSFLALHFALPCFCVSCARARLFATGGLCCCGDCLGVVAMGISPAATARAQHLLETRDKAQGKARQVRVQMLHSHGEPGVSGGR